jgi:uncharacterized protein (TIGR02271 family)
MQEKNVGGGQYARMNEMRDFHVSPDDPDPTGWAVVDRGGERVGKVDELIVDTAAMKVRYLEIELDDARTRDEHVLVSLDEVDLLDDQHKAVLQTLGHTDLRQRLSESSRQRAGAPDTAALAHDKSRNMADEATRLTRAEEEVRVGKREVQSGEVIVGKHIETERVSTPIERKIEHVRVERRPAGAQSPGNARMEDQEVRIPITEEEVVVDKRPVVKEEIVITKTAETKADTVETDVRKERIDVQGQGDVIEETGDTTRGRSGRTDRGGRRG